MIAKTLGGLAALTLTLALAGPAAAQDHEIAPDTTFTFQDDVVEGGYDSPQGTLVSGHHRGPRQSLVRARVHFVPELLKSVERL